MRKIIVSIHSTFNGIVTGPSTDPTNFMTWAQAGIDDSKEELLRVFDTVDAILLGRGTYEDLSTKWPVAKDWPDVTDLDLRLAEKVNSTPKFVVTGEHMRAPLAWGDFEAPTRLTGNIEERIRTLKEGSGGDIVTFGSATLVQSLTNADLIDEYRVLVHPVVASEGKHLFDNIASRKDLKLKSTQTFEHGAVLMHYDFINATTEIQDEAADSLV